MIQIFSPAAFGKQKGETKLTSEYSIYLFSLQNKMPTLMSLGSFIYAPSEVWPPGAGGKDEGGDGKEKQR